MIKSCKYILLFLTLFNIYLCQAQKESFSIHYTCFEMRSTLGNSYREYIYIENDTLFIRTEEIKWEAVQIEYDKNHDTQWYDFIWHKFISYKNDTTFHKNMIHLKMPFHSADRDSIIQLLNSMNEDSFFLFDTRMHHGIAQELIIKSGNRQVKYSMWNQGDSATFKIYSILNKCLPEKFRIYSLLNYYDSLFTRYLIKE